MVSFGLLLSAIKKIIEKENKQIQQIQHPEILLTLP